MKAVSPERCSDCGESRYWEVDEHGAIDAVCYGCKARGANDHLSLRDLDAIAVVVIRREPVEVGANRS